MIIRNITYGCYINDSQIRKHGRSVLMFFFDNDDKYITRIPYTTQRRDLDDGKDSLFLVTLMKEFARVEDTWVKPENIYAHVSGDIMYTFTPVEKNSNFIIYTKPYEELEEDLEIMGIKVDRKG